MYPVSDAFLRTLTGDHGAPVEVRAVPPGQTGPDPTGELLAVVDGSVTLDGTAKVRGQLNVTVGEQPWPRHADDRLGPWGRWELFARRGVDLGASGVEWVPLGYYRPVAPEQQQPPQGVVRVAARDRMWGITKARLLSPRQFPLGMTLGEVADNLIREVHPTAVIVWDDDSDQATLARALVCERDRYDFLRVLAESVGKLLWVGREGEFRFAAVDPERDPVWTLAQGEDGVLTTPSRALSVEEAFNAMVVEGESGDEADPVRGVAVDGGVNSPTRYGPPFGQFPRFFSSDFITTQAQADAAAVSMLRRHLGVPYSVDLASVPNPAVDPWDTVAVELADGTLEQHRLTRVTPPLLSLDMTCATREQRLVHITTDPAVVARLESEATG